MTALAQQAAQAVGGALQLKPLDAAFGISEIVEENMANAARVHAVAQQDHVQVLGHGVRAVRQRGIGRRRQHVVNAGEREHVGCVPAAAALHVVGVHRPPRDDAECVGHGHRLVQSVGVQRDGDVMRVGEGERGVDGAGVRAGVLVDLEAGRARARRRAGRAAAPLPQATG